VNGFRFTTAVFLDTRLHVHVPNNFSVTLFTRLQTTVQANFIMLLLLASFHSWSGNDCALRTE